MKKNQALCVLFCLLAAATALAQSDLYVGSNTSGETTSISSGTNSYDNTYIGFDADASHNTLIVSQPGTLLTNTLSVYVGYSGSG